MNRISLIEEFMLAANEAVALELKNRSIPTIYRVHENPDPEKLGGVPRVCLELSAITSAI